MFSHWIRRLSTRLWAINVAAYAVSLILLSSAAIYLIDHFPDALGRRQQMESVRHIVDGLRFDGTGQLLSVQLRERQALIFRLAPNDVKYRVLDATGRELLASTSADPKGKGDWPWLTQDLAEAAGTIAPATIGGKVFTVATQRVSSGTRIAYVQVAESKQFVEALVTAKIEPIPATAGWALLIATIIFGLTLPLTIRHVLRPLKEASDAAAKIDPYNLKTRLSSKGIPSEIKPLIDAFNGALTRLEKGFAVQQQFLAAAAHELQTPLTLLRGQIELQPEIKQRAHLLRDIDLMARQVRQLLHLAEVSEAQNFSFDDVNSLDVAQEVVAFLDGKADAKQVKLHIEAGETQPRIRADKSALFILLKNFVENAINVSPESGVVLLTIDEASIRIEDEGPGIRQDHLPFLFDRFWRAPDSKYDGAGLGLSICREIASAHQWRLAVDVLPTGTRFSVWL
ncbi:sensor histidine kinase [Trinickia dinghuensis]|uniref:histidine kinase n=1 Tax=Trinickia dinghuensis TaxID=2291023 RepID=A0A3D8K7N3_9BURK|nr:ATP-binding protein [Trinickia dinghuensis]RDV00937.1 HAMP domain-containing protein [Trinickia dinghuensis]